MDLISNLTLASGQITAADQIVMELLEAKEAPAVILLRWTAAPSVTDARRFAAVARAITAILAEARAALARHQAARCNPPVDQDHEAPPGWYVGGLS